MLIERPEKGKGKGVATRDRGQENESTESLRGCEGIEIDLEGGYFAALTKMGKRDTGTRRGHTRQNAEKRVGEEQ